jgi:hypothetical protein
MFKKTKKNENKREKSNVEVLVESPDRSASKGDSLLRDASTGVFYRGPAQTGSATGTNAGEKFWEV